MSDAIIYLDPDSPLSLQNQIRQKMVEAITLGTFPPGCRLPSSRKLADQLGVARNTVVLVYQQLVDEGYLVSRERSGIYVNEAILEGRVGYGGGAPESSGAGSLWRQRFKTLAPASDSYQCPPNWQQHPFAFIDGQYDRSLYPIREWRDATRQALSVKEINEWAGESGDADDALLVEQIRTKILPRRGIQASPDEILITVGTQQALYLLVEMFVDGSSVVAMEEPGYPAVRQMFAKRGARTLFQPVDSEGLVVDGALDQCALCYVTPSHQMPTGVTMSMHRREALLKKARDKNLLIIEDDFEFESNYLGNPHPALRSIDSGDRVLYVSSLSKVLAPGLRLGFMVASPEVIWQARRLRRLMVQHPPHNNQRTAAYFLSLGHYDSFIMHLNQTFKDRWQALRSALNHYLLHWVVTSRSQGGSAFWVKGPKGLDVKYLAQEAARRGILIEPVEDYYATDIVEKNCFRLGITSIGKERIREGIARLTELVRELSSGQLETLDRVKGEQVSGDRLKSVMKGASLICKTVYGDPCNIRLLEDGRMLGWAGFARENTDSGRWWVAENKWHRQWGQWEYGEESAFHIVISGDTIKFFRDDGRLYDTAVIHFNPAADAGEH